MSALWPRSGDQLMDNRGRPRVGAAADFFQANTTTPIVVYQDEGLTTPVTDPVITDGNGIWPTVFINDVLLYYRYRTKTSPIGSVLSDFIKVPAYGPAWWTSAAPPVVDPNALMITGDIVGRPDGVSRPGFCRCNARTIGNAASGATERANADTQALFVFLWNAAATYAVSGGRGASGAADYAANKTIALPDLRGRVLAGLDSMGNTSSARLAAASAANTSGGLAVVALTVAQLPIHDHGGTVAVAGAHTHVYSVPGSTGVNAGATPINGGALAGTATSSDGDHQHVIPPAGSNGAHENTQPWLSGGWFIKL